MEKPLDSVCVKECPTFNYNKLRQIDTDKEMGYFEFIRIKNQFFSGGDLDKSSDDPEFLGYKNNDFEGLVTKVQYNSFIKNFTFECFMDNKFSICKANK